MSNIFISNERANNAQISRFRSLQGRAVSQSGCISLRCVHMDTMATASFTGVMAQLFYIFLIAGNFTTNNALKASFNIMILRFNFTSNKSLLIIIVIISPTWLESAEPRGHVTKQRPLCFFGDLLEVKLNLKIIILKDSFNALFAVKPPVIRKI